MTRNILSIERCYKENWDSENSAGDECQYWKQCNKIAKLPESAQREFLEGM